MTSANLSKAARSALINAKSSHQGVPTGATGDAARELRDAGLIGPDGGLTRRGSAVRMTEVRKLEEEMFG